MADPICGTFKFAVDLSLSPYDPWELPYGKAPEGVYARVVERTFPLIDFRKHVLDEDYSMARSREYLRTHGFTAVKHLSSLHSTPVDATGNFHDLDSINEIYYPEIISLIKDVTGCSHVFPTDSLIRGPLTNDKTLSGSIWKVSASTGKTDASKPIPQSKCMHKAEPSPPTRLPHWDFTPLGARQTIRNWSRAIADLARQSGIIDHEDQTCQPTTATERASEEAIQQGYHGPRYAAYSVWRPLKKVTRDPLAMTPFSIQLTRSDYVVVPHSIKQPGIEDDWLRDLATLKVAEHAAEKCSSSTRQLQWHYISEQDIDEVLIVKAFDSAALKNQAELTGEAQAVPHASPDLGNAAYGDPRESIEVRLIAFW